MNFEIGSYVEWRTIKGYIRHINSEYATICVNFYDENIFDCCVVCYSSCWKDVIVHGHINSTS